MAVISIIVLYDCNLKNAKTLNSLKENFFATPDAFADFYTIIYDNGSINQGKGIDFPFEYRYIHKSDNEGLAVAYNFALKEGVKKAFKWLLLLDQDSILPHSFIYDLLEDIQSCQSKSNIVGLVPRMGVDGFNFSPSKVLPGGVHRPIDHNQIGISKSEIFAIGSGSLVNISFMRSVNGFNELFWLDSLDRWLFMKIYKEGKNVFVTKSVVEHDLSIMDYGKSVSAKRYNNIMVYETIFMMLYKSKSDNIIYIIRLIKRLLFFAIDVKKWKYFLLTYEHLKSLIFQSKDQIIKSYKRRER